MLDISSALPHSCYKDHNITSKKMQDGFVSNGITPPTSDIYYKELLQNAIKKAKDDAKNLTEFIVS
jgi:hypothetical protein